MTHISGSLLAVGDDFWGNNFYTLPPSDISEDNTNESVVGIDKGQNNDLVVCDFLGELEALLSSEGETEFLTRKEIQDRLGFTLQTTIKLLQTLSNQGRLDTKYITRLDIAGRRGRRPGYRLKKE